MRKIKKLLNVALIIIMVISMVACGTESAESLDELIALGAQYLLDGNYEEAVVAFDKAINVNDKCIVAYMGLGDGNLGLEDYDKAGAAFEKAIDLDSEYVEGYIGRADVYLFEENQAAALDILAEGYSATNDESLNTIIDEINTGTYEPSKLHENWEGIYKEYSNDATNEETATDDESWRDNVAKTIVYSGETADGGAATYKIEYYDASDKLLGKELYNSLGEEVASELESDLKPSGEKCISYYKDWEAGKTTKVEGYNENGNLVYVDYSDGNGWNIAKEEWYYENGNLKSASYYDGNGTITKREWYRENGNLWRIEEWDADGNPIY